MVYELAVVCGRILLTTSDYSLPVLRPLSDTSANVPTDDRVTSKWLSTNNQTATEWPNSGNRVPVLWRIPTRLVDCRWVGIAISTSDSVNVYSPTVPVSVYMYAWYRQFSVNFL